MMKSRNTRKCGFTLMEVIVVLIILGIMAMLVVPNILSYPDKARITATQSDIKTISNTIEIYKLHNRHYPSSGEGLQALVKNSDGSKNSSGYLKKVPADPWGNPYKYSFPGSHGDYDLYSMGADGKEGGDGDDADIGNWQL